MKNAIASRRGTVLLTPSVKDEKQQTRGSVRGDATRECPAATCSGLSSSKRSKLGTVDAPVNSCRELSVLAAASCPGLNVVIRENLFRAQRGNKTVSITQDGAGANLSKARRGKRHVSRAIRGVVSATSPRST